MEQEIWKDVKGYAGKYQVSNFGRVKSLNYNNIGKSRIMKPNIYKTGYVSAGLSLNGKEKRFLIHRLVAEAFIPNPDNYPVVNHKDENTQNNRADNLEWCTQKHNINYGTRNQRIAKVFSIGIIQYSKDLKKVKEFESMADAEKATGINKSHICRCCKGHRNYAGGYLWKYKNVE